MILSFLKTKNIQRPPYTFELFKIYALGIGVMLHL